MAEDKRPPFFREVHDLAQAHGIVAYVLVGVVNNGGSIAIASGAGSRLADDAEVTPRIYGMLEQAFEQAMVSITEPEPVRPVPPPKGGLLN
jgi:hypothetical protein